MNHSPANQGTDRRDLPAGRRVIRKGWFQNSGYGLLFVVMVALGAAVPSRSSAQLIGHRRDVQRAGSTGQVQAPVRARRRARSVRRNITVPLVAGSTGLRPVPGADASHIVRVWNLQRDVTGSVTPYGTRAPHGHRMLMVVAAPADKDLDAIASAGFTMALRRANSAQSPERAPGLWDFGPARTLAADALKHAFDFAYGPGLSALPPWNQSGVRPASQQDAISGTTEPYISPFSTAYRRFVSAGLTAAGRALPGRLCSAIVAPVPHLLETDRVQSARTATAWWCGDTDARTAYRTAMVQKYGGLDGLNRAWGTQFLSPEQVLFPAGPLMAARIQWLDSINWYLNSIAATVGDNCRSVRRIVPPVTVLAPVSVQRDLHAGQDSVRLIKAAAAAGACVLLEEPPSQFDTATGDLLLRLAATACRYYGAQFWVASHGKLTAEAEGSRLFTAASLGAGGIVEQPQNIIANQEQFYKYGRYLRVEDPAVDVAMVYPSTWEMLHPDSAVTDVMARGCAAVRPTLNYDVLDESMVRDGALDRYRVLALWQGVVYDSATLDRIRIWVQAGGTLAAYDFGKVESADGDRTWYHDLLGYAGSLHPAVRRLSNPQDSTTAGPANSVTASGPVSYQLLPAEPATARLLEGDWKAVDATADPPGRWTGAEAGIQLALGANSPAVVIVDTYIPPEVGNRRRELLINGAPVGSISAVGSASTRLLIPAAMVKSNRVRLSFRCGTWVPSILIPNSADNRALGVFVRAIHVEYTAATRVVPSAAPDVEQPTPTLDAARLRTEWAHQFGTGWTVFYPATRAHLDGYVEVLRYLTYHLSDLDSERRDAVQVTSGNDGVVATLTSDRVLYSNSGPGEVKEHVDFDPDLLRSWPAIHTPMTDTADVTVPVGGIVSLDFRADPAEVLLQCERFTQLDGLAPIQGIDFSPGAGYTQVLIPAGRTISTRIRIAEAGRYRVYYRAVRQGRLSAAAVGVDGRPLVNGDQLPLKRYSETLLAGIVNLRPGIHNLSIAPLPGDSIRADFVVVSTDPNVAGYGFAIVPPTKAATATPKSHSFTERCLLPHGHVYPGHNRWLYYNTGVTMLRSPLVTAALAGFILLSAVGAARAGIDDDVIAHVNGEAITRAEFISRMENVTATDLSPALQSPGPNVEGRSGDFALRSLIDEKLLTQFAAQHGSIPTEAEVLAYEAFIKRYPDPQMSMLPVDPYRTPEDLHRVVRDLVAWRKVLVKLSGIAPADVAASYSKNLDRYHQPDSVHVRLIDVKAKGLAEEALGLLKTGAQFEVVAKDHSEDPLSGPRGGDAGTVPNDIFKAQAPHVFDALKSLQPGEFTHSVITETLTERGVDPANARKQTHFFLAQLVERVAGHNPPLDEIRPVVENDTVQQRDPTVGRRLRDDITDFRTKARIDISLRGYEYLAHTSPAPVPEAAKAPKS